ncbi:hypothetical protein [Komagataeibacter europaeus]|uniref:hypothetical protein n=1 Tax=Komagataeibacter europaeus TaxID=33995 RepID=UPI0002F982EE|nr:hypothetical protein [Komagataeibacter europaeus]
MSDWNGLPDQPERSGWHITLDNIGDRHEFWWEGPDYQYWTTCEGGDLVWSIEEMAAEYSYVGAVYSASELAQMRKDERDRVAQVCERWAQACGAIYDLNPTDYSAGEADAWEEAVRAIRTLTDNEGKKS